MLEVLISILCLVKSLVIDSSDSTGNIKDTKDDTKNFEYYLNLSIVLVVGI